MGPAPRQVCCCMSPHILHYVRNSFQKYKSPGAIALAFALQAECAALPYSLRDMAPSDVFCVGNSHPPFLPGFKGRHGNPSDNDQERDGAK